MNSVPLGQTLYECVQHTASMWMQFVETKVMADIADLRQAGKCHGDDDWFDMPRYFILRQQAEASRCYWEEFMRRLELWCEGQQVLSTFYSNMDDEIPRDGLTNQAQRSQIHYIQFEPSRIWGNV